MTKKAYTIVDVAKAVGVSPSTVSHAISGKRTISMEVRHKIFEKMQELDYRPNFFARAIKNNSTQLIGVVIDNIANLIAAEHINAMTRLFAEHDYDVVLGLAGDDVVKGREMLRKFSSGMVDGIVNMLPQIDSVEAAILCGRVPVYTNLRDEYDPIILDYHAMTRDILEYLWGQGHRKIGYIASYKRASGAEDPAVAAYCSFLASRNIAFDSRLIAQGDDTLISGHVAMEKLYRQVKVTAVFAGNDQMALGVYRWAHEHNLRIPEDLSVVGYDDSMLAELAAPPLTTARYPIVDISRHNVEALLNKMKDKTPSPQGKIVKMPLIIRKSVHNILQKQEV